MRHFRLLLIAALCLPGISAFSNGIEITDVSVNASYTQLTISLGWQNSWHILGPSNDDYEDGAWVFIKYRNQNSTQWQHLTVDDIISSSSDSGSLDARTIRRDGVYILHALFEDYEGYADVTFTVAIGDSTELIKPSFQVHAIEMINPNSSTQFEIGDGVSPNRFCDGGDTTVPYVFEPGIITMVEEPGALWSTDPNFEPGSVGDSYIPGRLNSPLVMKYEISQQQYVDFLNSLTRAQQNSRTATDLNDSGNNNVYVMSNTLTPQYRNGIRRDSFVATGPYTFYVDLSNNGEAGNLTDGENIACNYLSPDDLMAYCDWACMRPMGEIEYERFCRGSDPAVAGEYAWGTTDLTMALISPLTAGRPFEVAVQTGQNGLCRSTEAGPMRTGFAARDTSDRLQAGAGSQGFMELTGNVAELVASFTTVSDRYFDAREVGDGKLSILGDANQPTWPGQLTVRGRAEDPTKVWTVSRRGVANATGRSPHHGGRGVRAKL